MASFINPLMEGNNRDRIALYALIRVRRGPGGAAAVPGQWKEVWTHLGADAPDNKVEHLCSVYRMDTIRSFSLYTMEAGQMAVVDFGESGFVHCTINEDDITELNKRIPE
jgi:hypothetical protein